MTFDIFLFVWVLITLLISTSPNLKVTETVLGKQEMRHNMGFAIMIFLPVFLCVVFGDLRGDLGVYVTGYKLLNSSVSDVLANWSQYKGGGFELIEVFIKQFFGDNITAFRMIIALIQSIPIVLVYRKYSEDYALSIFLFVANGYYDGWMMNGVRQFLAVCIIFAATPLMLKKKYLPLAVVVVLLAYTVHQSAIMMLAVIILAHFKPWKYLTLCSFVVFTIVLYLYVERSLSDDLLSSSSGANPVRILISAVPVALAFYGRKKIEEQDNQLINMCINMSVITMLIYVIATLTSGLLTGRLPIYTSMYNLILLPYLVNRVFNEHDSKVLRTTMIIVYSLYFILDMFLL